MTNRRQSVYSRRQADAERGRAAGRVSAARAKAERDLAATIARVRALHQNFDGVCGTCADATGQAATWPCDTTRALDTPPTTDQA
ncbi:hypothetical protein PUR28_11660 [Streptomyces sp. BE308]|uniref:hypothetical protein n=1 Tax=unclassified Streptomyces TaxID=2593676 RepID=UPI002DD964A5|nr:MULTISPECIES: hypothetical protein [unclassified Streptomyces]MEE1791418.1 hypothetical protein [Streptomyces sp. BE308]WRZ73003.1 hypothetical protein OG251_15960 [Streptomyces sp. NBC_01237]